MAQRFLSRTATEEPCMSVHGRKQKARLVRKNALLPVEIENNIVTDSEMYFDEQSMNVTNSRQ